MSLRGSLLLTCVFELIMRNQLCSYFYFFRMCHGVYILQLHHVPTLYLTPPHPLPHSYTSPHPTPSLTPTLHPTPPPPSLLHLTPPHPSLTPTPHPNPSLTPTPHPTPHIHTPLHPPIPPSLYRTLQGTVDSMVLSDGGKGKNN